MGESVDYLTIRQWDLDDGVMFSEADVARGQVCFLAKRWRTICSGAGGP